MKGTWAVILLLYLLHIYLNLSIIKSKTKLHHATFLPNLQWLFNALRVKANSFTIPFKAHTMLTLSPYESQLISISHSFPATLVFFQFLKLTTFLTWPWARMFTLLTIILVTISLANSCTSLNEFLLEALLGSTNINLTK